VPRDLYRSRPRRCQHRAHVRGRRRTL